MAALRLLGFRMHSEAELSRKLRTRGYEDEDIAEVIARCVRLGYLNDAAFAATLVERRSSTSGAAAMAAELRRKGIRRAEVDAALGVVDRDTEVETAAGLFARYAGRDTTMTDRQLLEKIGARLQRRGFSPQVVREALRRHRESEYRGPDAASVVND